MCLKHRRVAKAARLHFVASNAGPRCRAATSPFSQSDLAKGKIIGGVLNNTNEAADDADENNV